MVREERGPTSCESQNNAKRSDDLPETHEALGKANPAPSSHATISQRHVSDDL